MKSKNRVTFLGGSLGTPNGTILDINGYRILIDPGLAFMGREDDKTLPRALRPKKVKGPPFDPSFFEKKKIDAVIATHIHLDHAGAIPCAAPFLSPRALIWAHRITNLSMPMVFRDTLFHSPSLYSRAMMEETLRRRDDLKIGENQILPGLTMYAKIAKHIPGAISLTFESGEERYHITGDMSRHDTLFTNGTNSLADLPPEWRPTHILGTDLTHGSALRRDWNEERERLIDRVQKVRSRGGRAIVAGFGFGRGPEAALSLAQAGISCYADGMIRKVLRLYEETLEIKVPELITPIENEAHRQELVASEKSFVVVTTAGMHDAGPILAYSYHSLPRGDDALIFTSYLAPDSIGAEIRDKYERGKRNKTIYAVKLPNPEGEVCRVEIRAEVEQFSLSAHADILESRGYFNEGAQAQGAPYRLVCLTHAPSTDDKATAASLLQGIAEDIIYGECGVSVEI